MKKILKTITLIGVTIMVLESSVLAKEVELSYSHNCEEHYTVGDERASGYRCLNSTCRAYLEQRRELSKCAYCDSIMHAYECIYCGNWYPICGNGHYNTAVGDTMLERE